MSKKDVNGQIQEAEEALAGSATAAGPDAPASADAASTEDAPEAAATLARELAQAKDQLLRQAAEFQNYRRRTEKERGEWVLRGQAQVIEPMLTVLDDFMRSLEASQQVEQQETPGPAYQALKEGVELVYQNFQDTLAKLGVEAIDAVGQPFDERLHEAMMQMPAPEGTASGIVLQEIQRGYRLGERVLRHARVIVAA